MTYRDARRWRLALPPAALLLALGGCATDAPEQPPITGRQITQNAPAPDYSVFYWNALRACLQTGRSEWECKSGEQQFVRDALAVEAEISAQRRQRRMKMLALTGIDEDEAPVEPERESVATRLGQSVMFEQRPDPAPPAAPAELPTGRDLPLTPNDAAPTNR